MKTKLQCFFIGLALLAVVHPVLAQPALGIVRTNNQVILFWPIIVGGTNGVLQSVTNLVSPNWLSATDAFPVNYGSHIAVSVTNVSLFKVLSVVTGSSHSRRHGFHTGGVVHDGGHAG